MKICRNCATEVSRAYCDLCGATTTHYEQRLRDQFEHGTPVDKGCTEIWKRKIMQPDQILPEKDSDKHINPWTGRSFKAPETPEPEPESTETKLTFQQKIDAGYYAV